MYMQPNEAIFVQCKYLQSQREKKRAIATLFLHFWLDKTKWREIPRPITRWWDVFTSHMLTRLWFKTLLSFLLIRFIFFYFSHMSPACCAPWLSIIDQWSNEPTPFCGFRICSVILTVCFANPITDGISYGFSGILRELSGLTYLFVFNIWLDFKLIKLRNSMLNFVVVGLICTDCVEFC